MHPRHPHRFHAGCSLLVAALALGCGSEDAKGGGAEKNPDAGDGAGGSGGAAGTGGTAGDGGVAGTGGAGGTEPDASIDASDDGPADAPIDMFGDAPPRPDPTDPMAVVLFGDLDGIDLTGTYTFSLVSDSGASLDRCGAASQPQDAGAIVGFDIRRSDEFDATVVTVRYSDPIVPNPPVGPYDQSDWWDISISRFARIDGSTRLVTFRAGQVTTGSELLGDVRAEDLDGAGHLDAFFHITKARRVVSVDEGIKDGNLYLWVGGTCR